jgi:hypothetical protein
MAKARHVSTGVVYKAKRGHIYDPNHPKYNCYSPANDGVYSVFDAWVCDERGNVHPGYNISPVPIRADYIGDEVNHCKVHE